MSAAPPPPKQCTCSCFAPVQKRSAHVHAPEAVHMFMFVFVFVFVFVCTAAPEERNRQGYPSSHFLECKNEVLCLAFHCYSSSPLNNLLRASATKANQILEASFCFSEGGTASSSFDSVHSNSNVKVLSEYRS